MFAMYHSGKTCMCQAQRERGQVRGTTLTDVSVELEWVRSEATPARAGARDDDAMVEGSDGTEDSTLARESAFGGGTVFSFPPTLGFDLPPFGGMCWN